MDVSGEATGSCDACCLSYDMPAEAAGGSPAEAGPVADLAVPSLDQAADRPDDDGHDERADRPDDGDADAPDDGNVDAPASAARDGASDLREVAAFADLRLPDTARDTAVDTGVSGDAARDLAGNEAGLPDDGCSGPARGLTLSRLALYQAVEIPLMQDGVAVTSASRKADVVVGRAALARTFVELGPDWVPRELAVRLHLASGGRETVLYAKKVLTADSQAGSLASTIQIDVGGELITAETRYWVEAVECTPDPPGSPGRARFPTSGDAALDARPTGKLTIAFVPIAFGGLYPDTSDAAIAIYRNYIAAMYPASEVATSVVEGFSYTPTEGPWTEGYATYVTDLLDWTAARRSYDHPADDVYYYGLFRPAESFDHACGDTDCVDGMGYVADTSRFQAAYRVAVSFAFADEPSARTIAHELGHNHGRRHAPCNDPNNPDPDYPYAGGSVGVWGYDRRDRSLEDPATVTDIMGYCKTVWISDYTYQALRERIAYLNGLTFADVRTAARPAPRWRGLWWQGANVRWAKAPSVAGEPAGATSTARILDAGGSLVGTVTVYLQEVSLPGTRMALVPEPQAGWHAIELPGSAPIAFGTGDRTR